MASFGGTIGSAEVLPVGTERVGVQECDPTVVLGGLGGGAEEVLGIERRVAVHLSVAFARVHDPRDERRRAGLAGARMPDREADVFLAIVAEKVVHEVIFDS